ncbi:MAG TPA: DUF308 domain-containing protein, partial [Chitinophagaceae bacterium]|nr:DUF308 domain-containing protein [Chitinophagaceae bacterium]
LLSGIHLIRLGFALRKETSSGLFMLLIGILAALVAVATIFNIGTGAVAISVLLGLQVLLVGIALLIFSFVKKSVGQKIRNRLSSPNG